MGRVAAVRFAAHIDQRGDLVQAQERDEIFGSVIAVADGEHTRRLSKIVGITRWCKWRWKLQLACTLSGTSYRVWTKTRSFLLVLFFAA